MALPRFDLVNASSIEEAAGMLKKSDKKAKVIGGGTDLLHGFKDNIYDEYPEEIINIGLVKDASYIKEEEDGVHIGALAKLHDIEMDKMLNASYTVLSEAASTVASPQIRNASTIAGNICQEPRCWYYRNADNLFHCLRKGGDACPAFIGRNDIHSICGAMRPKSTPCQEECPNSTPIPQYFEEIRKGNPEMATRKLLSVNPLMALTGRVCPHTCQSCCNRAELDEEVSIRDIEREVGDYFIKNAKNIIPKGFDATGKSVAIIGAGPAGLTAAYFLSLSGHKVTVYDMNEKAGGMLVYGIPSYRLPKDLVEANVQIIRDMGVEIKLSTKIGKDITLEQIKKDNDAVLVGIGAWISMGLGCKGDDAKGVEGGIDILARIARKEDVGIEGKVVGIVGGGNTAMDCCRSAKRLGAKKVYNFYRRTQAEMPADEIEIIEATEEGIEFKYLVAPEEIIAKDGKVAAIKLQKMELGAADASGRRRPEPTGEFETVDVDMIISAIGQGVDPSGCEACGTTKRNYVKADDTFATDLAGVFAAGDGAQGPATAIKAIANARAAVASINAYLGCENFEDKFEEDAIITFDKDSTKPSKKFVATNKEVSKRTLYDEDVASVGLTEITKEAKRCFDCACVAASPSDTAPALIALGAKIVTTKRTIDADKFFGVGVCSSTVLADDELVVEVVIPKATANQKSTYMKYRHRKAIDFPLLSVAVSLDNDGKALKGVRIVLGAAAPIPVRVKAAEDFLNGKALTEENAIKAAELVLKGVMPLEHNKYKVQVAKTYIKRAIMACNA